ncbi:MAG: hypothetical protein HQL29_01905 [Candidatus Omnitrophica bacterium]|nr:hypothetical protein [Candidatus Omnitrophota bacterium]
MNNEKEILEQLEQSPYVWGRTFCKHHFRSKSPKFHIEILNAVQEERYLAVAAPRESAKSTMLAFLYPLHSICFKKRRFIVIVSNTFKKGAGALETIKKEIRENKRINEDYPIEITKDAEGDSIFRHSDGFEIRVLCKGAEQIGSIRGEKFGAYRPDLILGDDIEDDELVRNPQRRRELEQVINEALIPAGDRKVCKYVIIGTILHDDSFMAKLVSSKHYPDFKKMKYQALTDGKSLWSEKWTVNELLKIQKEKPSVFAKEYQNDPVSGSMAIFKKEDFRYWEQYDNSFNLFDDEGNIVGKGKMNECRAAIACDLAWSDKRTADETVLMPAFLTPDNQVIVGDYINEKGMKPDRFSEHLFLMVEKLEKLTDSTVDVGFEKAMLEKVTNWMLKKEMKDRNKYLFIKELKWDKDKISRIETTLQARYAQHVLYHKQGMGDLEHQLMRFPSAAHDDLCDALCGVVRLLKTPKNIKANMGQEDDMFDWLRDNAVPNNKKPIAAGNFLFGKQKHFSIQAKKTFK